MGLLTSLGKSLIRIIFVLAAVTAVGQIPFKGDTIENHYHAYVNSSSFQASFKIVARPVTWTGEKLSELISSSRTRAASKLSGR